MDDKKLKDILHSVEPPQVDENAKKRALNLAMAEFAASGEKNKKTSQGFPFFSRLMGNSTDKMRSETMEQKTKKKLVYGGMATAMAVVLIAGTTLMQTQEILQERQRASTYSGGGNNFSSIAMNINKSTSPIDRMAEGLADLIDGDNAGQQSTPETEDITAVMREAINEHNDRSTEEAFLHGSSAIPIPIDPPVGVLQQAPAEPPIDHLLKNLTPEKEVAEADMSAPAINMPFGTMPSKRMLAERKATAGSIAAGNSASMIAPAPDMPPQAYQVQNRDKFEHFDTNPFKQVSEEAVSTFSADVDTASYAFVRKQINQGRLPNKDAVRIEEMVNYFDYNYPAPTDKSEPFKASVTVTDSPWSAERKLMHIGIKGYEMDVSKAKSNLVFLIDTSGSMNNQDKLPLLISSFKLMLDSMNPDDTISIVTYAGSAGAALEPTKVSDKAKIISALENLRAGGSTAGAAGINLAYQLAEQNFDKEAVNRVILATDGDFNVGTSSPDALKKMVERKRESGIFLSVLGFGQGNLNDQTMQTLAQNGNGTASYIDTLNEARKVLVEEAGSTLFPIAKDVKFQVEFNPSAVSEYRLVGYETRHLRREDFNNDKIDAGDIGAGHTVTAIYEITPVGAKGSVDPLRYGSKEDVKQETESDSAEFENEYAFLKMRYKLPNEDTSKLITTPVTTALEKSFNDPECGPTEDCIRSINPDTRFSIAVASFAQKLKGSTYTGEMSYDDIIDMANSAKGADPFGYRNEFIQMVRLAKSLDQ